MTKGIGNYPSSSDFKSIQAVYQRIEQNVKAMSRLRNPDYLDIYNQIDRMLKNVRLQHLEITQSTAFASVASHRLEAMFRVNERFQDLASQVAISPRIFEDLNRVHQSWYAQLGPSLDSLAQLQAAAKLSFSDVAYQLTVAERLFAQFDFEGLRQVSALSESAILTLQSVVDDVTLSYRRLSESIGNYADLMFLPASALPGATREVFITGYAVESICIPEKPGHERDESIIDLRDAIEQETYGCMELLQSIDPALAGPYLGARNALDGRSPDRARHILSSLRELWYHLLRSLAPDEQVLAWMPKNNKDLLHEGRPTHRARILYACRRLNHGPLSDFIDQDTKALLKLVNLCNRVHELDPGFTDEQLRVLLLRTESWVTYIIPISAEMHEQ